MMELEMHTTITDCSLMFAISTPSGLMGQYGSTGEKNCRSSSLKQDDFPFWYDNFDWRTFSLRALYDEGEW